MFVSLNVLTEVAIEQGFANFFKLNLKYIFEITPWDFFNTLTTHFHKSVMLVVGYEVEDIKCLIFLKFYFDWINYFYINTF